MKRAISLLFLGMTACAAGFSATPASTYVLRHPGDTLSNVRMQAVEVYSYKTFDPLLRLPASLTQLGGGVTEIPARLTSLAAVVPNFHMPDYGSKLSSALYIRGVGSRMNDPAVGLYVDNVPLLDKGMYDFDMWELSRAEIVRGPQGSLWGRNSMGGVVSLYTPSPLLRRGNRARVSFGSVNSLNANIVHYHRLSDDAGLSAGVDFRRTDGFFPNLHTPGGRNADARISGSVRLRLDWRMSRRLTGEFSASAEQSSQSGYPYASVDASGRVDEVNYNSPAGYDRRWLLGSAHMRYAGDGFSLAGTASFQHFDDKMTLDQDFTPEDLFSMIQKQNQNALTAEVILKSEGTGKYRWLFGAFGFYKHLSTRAPVDLKKDFFTDIFSDMPLPPRASVTAMGDCLSDGFYSTPSRGVAAFHQSDLSVGEFTFSAGLRIDRERVSIDHNTTGSLPLRVVMPPAFQAMDMTAAVAMSGADKRSFTQFSPKLSVNWTPGEPDGDRVYATVSRGYRAGGYNIQLFSDLLSGAIRSARGSEPVQVEVNPDDISYKPEYSWNYEIGARKTMAAGRITIDGALFYIDTRDQQVTQMVGSGLGRVMRNAARSASHGAELSARGVFGGFAADAAWGYTHAAFRDYRDMVEERAVDYSGNFVPFAPRHTLSAGVRQTFDTASGEWWDSISVGLRYTGVGEIYYTEDNGKPDGNDNAKQGFYGLLSADVTLRKDRFSLRLWGRNLTGTEYKTFFFRGMTTDLAQRGEPTQIGATMEFDF